MRKFETGEIFTNNSGTVATIVDFITGTKTKSRRAVLECEDGTRIIVQTPKLKTGNWKNPNEPTVCGVGYIGQGEFKSSIKGKPSVGYTKWNRMLSRCYLKTDAQYPFYGGSGVTVCDEWHNYQNFAKWFYENYNVFNNDVVLDKDIRYPESFKGFCYCPRYCCLVSSRVNLHMSSIATNMCVQKAVHKGVNLWSISSEGKIQYSSRDCNIVERMLWDLRLKKILEVGRMLERSKLFTKDIQKDFYEKVNWVIDNANKERECLKEYLKTTFIEG